MNKHSGFTLIELIIVVAIIAVIAGAVFVAIDPARRLHAARNSTRWSDVTSVLEAVKKYQVDNSGDLPSTAVAIDSDASSYQLIGESVGTCSALTCAAVSPIASTNCGISGLDTDLAGYISLPKDPRNGTTNDTRYYVNKDANGIIYVGACDAEAEGAGGGGTAPAIEVKR